MRASVVAPQGEDDLGGGDEAAPDSVLEEVRTQTLGPLGARVFGLL
ncbi:hypothetical protein [Streptomyces pseudovenezuelae]|nr:hypothetical protein [Streptomyces pseudovenezuelae]